MPACEAGMCYTAPVWNLRAPHALHPRALSFRELPAVLAALRKLSRKPDAVMCDGQGIAHPRRLDLVAAEELVLRCGGGYRLPEPIRRAHRLVTESKRERDR